MRKVAKTIIMALSLTIAMFPITTFGEEVKPVEYEKALMRYVLSYEALQNAKQDPEQSSKLPKLYKKYRENYSKYIKLLHDEELYNPEDEKSENDPGGNYNKKKGNDHLPQRQWASVNTKTARENVKTQIKNGGDIDSSIESTTSSSVPARGHSQIDLSEFGICAPRGWEPEDGLPPNLGPEVWGHWSKFINSPYFDEHPSLKHSFKDSLENRIKEYNASQKKDDDNNSEDNSDEYNNPGLYEEELGNN